jgi:hypothetical protein
MLEARRFVFRTKHGCSCSWCRTTGSGLGAVAGCCEQGNEHWGSILFEGVRTAKPTFESWMDILLCAVSQSVGCTVNTMSVAVVRVCRYPHVHRLTDCQEFQWWNVPLWGVVRLCVQNNGGICMFRLGMRPAASEPQRPVFHLCPHLFGALRPCSCTFWSSGIQLVPHTAWFVGDKCPLCKLVNMRLFKRLIAQTVYTVCTRISYKIFPVTNLNKYLHCGTNGTE